MPTSSHITTSIVVTREHHRTTDCPSTELKGGVGLLQPSASSDTMQVQRKEWDADMEILDETPPTLHKHDFSISAIGEPVKPPVPPTMSAQMPFPTVTSRSNAMQARSDPLVALARNLYFSMPLILIEGVLIEVSCVQSA